MPPAELSPPFLSNPTAGEFLSRKEQLFPPPSQLCWRLSRLRQRRRPRSPPGRAGARNSSSGLAGSREQLAQPKERHRGREDGGDRNRHVHVFSLRETTFPAPSAKRTRSRDAGELPCSGGSALGQHRAAAWVLAGWDLSKRRNTGSPFWMQRDLTRPRGICFLVGRRERRQRTSVSFCAGLEPQLEPLEQGEESFPRSP